MHIDELLENDYSRQELLLIVNRCGQFIEESQGFPLLKNLPSANGDFHKVKVRQRKGTPDVDEKFNEAFVDEHFNLRQRAVFANGPHSFEPADPNETGMEPYFVFPIDGYRFLYSKEVKNSSMDYKQVFEVVYDQFGSEKGNEIITDLLKFAYSQTNLLEGLESGAEIIVYNIPYFYTIRTSIIDDYDELLTTLERFL